MYNSNNMIATTVTPTVKFCKEDLLHIVGYGRKTNDTENDRIKDIVDLYTEMRACWNVHDLDAHTALIEHVQGSFNTIINNLDIFRNISLIDSQPEMFAYIEVLVRLYTTNVK